MTQTTTPPDVNGATEAPSPTGRTRVVALLLAGSAIVSAVNMLTRPAQALEMSGYDGFLAVRDSGWTFALVAGVAFAVVYLTTGLAACQLAPTRGRHLATIGAVLTGLGGLGFALGFSSWGTVHWYLTSEVAGAPASRALFDLTLTQPGRVFGVQGVGFLTAATGMLLVGVALWRARTVPRWLAAGVPVSLAAMVFLGGSTWLYSVLHAVMMATLLVLAWYVWRAAADLRGRAVTRG